MADYLLRLSDDGELLLFSDAQELTEYLDGLIQDAWYDGTKPLIGKIWKWDSADERQELTLLKVKETPEGDDFEDWDFVLFSTESVPDVKFSVRIDLRRV